VEIPKAARHVTVHQAGLKRRLIEWLPELYYSTPIIEDGEEAASQCLRETGDARLAVIVRRRGKLVGVEEAKRCTELK
jgi:hypothetical protein